MIEKTADAASLPPPTARRWPRVLMLLLIFVCGGVAGAATGGYWMRERMIVMMRHPEQVPDRILPRIRAELTLDDAQTQKVEEIVRRRHAAMENHRAASYPRQLAEFREMNAEIAELLSLEQRDQWSAFCDSIEQRYLPARPVTR